MSMALPARPAGIRDEARAVDVWLARAAWTVVALSCLQVLCFALGRDQGIYAVVGDSILAGKMPYRDAWDFKPPGIFLVYAFAEALFGKAMASVRIVEVTGLVALVFAFKRLGRTLFGSDVAGLLGGALATLIHAQLEFWHTAQPESFGGMLTAFALVLTTKDADTSERSSSRSLRWVSVGALFGAAFLLKPPLGGGALACAAYVMHTEWRRARSVVKAVVPAFVIGGASLVPIFLCALWFWARGAWPALSWTLFEFTPGYTALGWHGAPGGLVLYGFEEAFKGFSYLLPVLLVAAAVLPARTARERGALLLVAGIVSVHVVGIALQAKFFQYHYGATLPLLSLIGGLGLYKLAHLAAKVPVVGVPLFAVGVVALTASRVALRHNPGTFWERSAARMRFLFLRDESREELDATLYYVVDYSLDTDRRAARFVSERTSLGDAVFVWGFEPAIYWLSGRALGSRYLYDVPQRAPWQQAHAREDLMADLARTQPKIVLVQHGDVFSFVTGDSMDSYDAVATFPELGRLLDEKYRSIAPVDDLDVYERR
jgi:hypothetical protein